MGAPQVEDKTAGGDGTVLKRPAAGLAGSTIAAIAPGDAPRIKSVLLGKR